MNTIFRKTVLFISIIGILNATEKTESIALFSEYGEDELAFPYFDRDGNLLFDVRTKTNTMQFYQDVKWVWNKIILEESQSVKSIIHTEDNILYAGTYPNAVMFKSVDSGETWSFEVSFADSSQSHVLTLEEMTNGDILAGTYPQVGVERNARIYKLPYGETEWIPLPYLPEEGAGHDSVLANKMVRDITEDSENNIYISLRAIVVYPNGHAYPRGQVWKSDNGGETWSTTGKIGGFYVQYANSLLTHNGGIYVSTGTYEEGEVFFSDNNGESWNKVGGRLYEAGEVWTLAADNDNTIYAGSNYFHRLKNEGKNGETWETFPTPDGSDIRILKIGNDGLLYCGTMSGNIFRTADGGETWDLIGALKQQTDSFIDSSFALHIYDLAESEDVLYAATAMRPEAGSYDYHGTIFGGTEAGLGITETQLSLPSLRYSVYPNPARQGRAMHLNIDLPLGAGISGIKIYNILGQLVKDVNFSQIKPGFRTNIIIWNGKDIYGRSVPNGIYFLRLTIQNADGKIINSGAKLIYTR